MTRNFLLLFALLLVIASCKSPASKAHQNWEVYGGTKEAIHYSSLTEVDTGNVSLLQPAWTYHTGDVDTALHSQIQCNPVVIDGIMYALSPRMKLFAVDAATGKEKWVFDPAVNLIVDTSANSRRMNSWSNTGRGVTYWTDGKEDQRIFYTAGPTLICLDASTGKPVTGFGVNGTVDLHNDLGRDVSDRFITSNTPGIIYKDVLIMGSRVSEGADAAPGHIRAYDVRTGKLKWIFHTIPQPGEYGFDTWPDTLAYKNLGAANNWSGMSLDEERGIVFVPTGSIGWDFYGGKRPGNNLFANCLLALDASTGKRIWHFQTIHHDMWDRDLPTAPVLVTITKDGKKIDAVAQTTKTGFVYLFERETGKPVYPIEEKPVPTDTELKDEIPSPTQPFPTWPKPLVRQTISASDLNDLVPDSSYQDIKNKLASYKNGNMFSPPSKQGTVIFPGYDGGAEWGGPAYDPATGILYVNANEMAWVLTMVDVKNEAAKAENYLQAGKRLYTLNCMACHGPERKGSGNYPTLVDVNKKYTESTFQQLLVSGRRMMPALTRLSEQERKAIASFILDTRQNQQQKFVPEAKPEDRYMNLPYSTTGYNKFLTKEGYPAVKPPWGTLSAINLNTGEYVWKDTLGDYPEFKAKGIHTGTENYGGPVVTAGGLIFIAATRDNKFRAFNKRTGELLWEADLPASGFATPAVYHINGKQFIVIACGGGKLKTNSGDAYVAFALPDKK